MTPKEKADEIFLKYGIIIQGCNAPTKECALIAVDEIIKELDAESWGLEMDTAFEKQKYWQQVKQEIKKL